MSYISPFATTGGINNINNQAIDELELANEDTQLSSDEGIVNPPSEMTTLTVWKHVPSIDSILDRLHAIL